MKVLLAVLLVIAAAYVTVGIVSLLRVPHTDPRPVKAPSLSLSPAVTKLVS